VRHSFIAMIGVALVFGGASAAAGQAARVAPNDRAAAQARIRDRVARLLRERVGLSDDQLRRLAPVSRSYDERRRSLFREERAARQALRLEVGAGSADQTRVAGYIDQLLALQRRRVDLAAEEQRELAAFMTPVQRARYLALQEHLRRRTEEMRRRRGNGLPRGAGRRGAPGGPPGS
jgi:Spy/CpxP family protein refolding chaperone